ncbi:MAG: DUF4031 domain-containing protein [Stutzerimonas stutzeri]|nr:MAG: DUF4031 domain-containing protein [Stutzerimonas stutzeri]
MTVYVDPLAHWGWVMRGRVVQSCHLFTDTLELDALHDLAARIGMKRGWFQDKASAPHYDLTPSRCAAAIAAGAVQVDRHAAVAIWRQRRVLVAEQLALSRAELQRGVQ